MDQQTEGQAQAGLGNAAGPQSKSDKTKDTISSRNNGISFVLPIDGNYRITADEYAWRIEKRKGKSWRAIEWHSDIEALVNSLAQRMIRTSEVQTVAEALAAVENVSRTLRDALGPRFTVEVRS